MFEKVNNSIQSYDKFVNNLITVLVYSNNNRNQSFNIDETLKTNLDPYLKSINMSSSYFDQSKISHFIRIARKCIDDVLILHPMNISISDQYLLAYHQLIHEILPNNQTNDVTQFNDVADAFIHNFIQFNTTLETKISLIERKILLLIINDFYFDEIRYPNASNKHVLVEKSSISLFWRNHGSKITISFLLGIIVLQWYPLWYPKLAATLIKKEKDESNNIMFSQSEENDEWINSFTIILFFIGLLAIAIIIFTKYNNKLRLRTLAECFAI
ncbi:hypothetical protein BLOT_006763 [Blomia tropicalis]|nr:hypothetical protein BLOT_006763 [Blomia tropicalis]